MTPRDRTPLRVVLRTALNVFLRVAPPVAFAVWGVRFLGDLLSPAVPAFGSIDAHLARHHMEMVRSGAVGALIAVAWAFAWSRLPGLAAGRGRRRLRSGRASAVRSPSAD